MLDIYFDELFPLIVSRLLPLISNCCVCSGFWDRSIPSRLRVRAIVRIRNPDDGGVPKLSSSYSGHFGPGQEAYSRAFTMLSELELRYSSELEIEV